MRCPTLFDLMQQGAPLGTIRPTPATTDLCFGLREPFLSWCRVLGQIGSAATLPGPRAPGAPSAQPQIPGLPPPPISFASTFSVKLGVHQPPELNPEVYAALDALNRAHRAAGAPATTLTDWYRTPTENLAQPGSSATSLHLRGLAFDLRADAGGAATTAAWSNAGLRFLDERNVPGVPPHWHLEYA